MTIERSHLKIGDAVYIQDCKDGVKKSSKKFKINGHGLCLLLGIIPHFGKELKEPSELFRAMSAVGFISFDDVGEFLGDEAAKILVKKFERKYTPPALSAPGAPQIDVEKTLALHGEDSTKEESEAIQRALDVAKADPASQCSAYGIPKKKNFFSKVFNRS